MHYARIHGLTAEADVWLRATETEISASLWAHMAWEGVYIFMFYICFQCFDTALLIGLRKSILPLKNLSDVVLACLSVWFEVQFAYGPADATATPSSLALLKSRMVCLSGASLSIVLEKELLNRTAFTFCARRFRPTTTSFVFCCQPRSINMLSNLLHCSEGPALVRVCSHNCLRS